MLSSLCVCLWEHHPWKTQPKFVCETLTIQIIMTLICVCPGVGWRGGGGGVGGVHAFHPISSLGMRQQLWRYPEDQMEKKKCYWYSLCSQSSTPVMSFWMKAVVSLITVLYICSQNDFSWSTALITSLNAQKYFMALTVQSSHGQPGPLSVFVNKILLELLCTSIYVFSTAAFMLQCQSEGFW